MFIMRSLVPILLLASFGRLAAQEPSPVLEAGSRIRLTYPCELALGGSLESSGRACRSDGRLASLTGDTIEIEEGDSRSAHPLESLSRVEVSAGTRSHWLAGAAIGFVVGGTVAYVALSSGGSTSICDRSANQDAVSVGECIALATAVGGLPGFGLGALVGTFIRSERWQEVPLNRLRVSAGPAPGAGLRFIVSITH
ncbi:MAG: hypothetical protein P8Y07_04225 [Gemmatimonadales bacterium]